MSVLIVADSNMESNLSSCKCTAKAAGEGFSMAIPPTQACSVITVTSCLCFLDLASIHCFSSQTFPLDPSSELVLKQKHCVYFKMKLDHYSFCNPDELCLQH